ncbi:hypothetical protein B0J14DRAFT_169192 [Halenospora varia]|nr:hypothetical protein B0J14DRAFT_169192 [Halenospora varia]
MECLGIPVDHRLRTLIRKIRPIGISKVTGAHLQILREFGESLVGEDDEPINISELNFALDLAGPDTTGGILVLLLQPLETQMYKNGFIADVDDCKTLKAIRQLVSLASNQLSGLDNVSVFDMLPFLTEEYEDKDIFRTAHEALVRMIRAKAPSVVICCARGTSHNRFVRDIHGLGIGKTFSSKELQNGASTFLRVNAFHPSYSVNYNRSYSCFRRLLILEFVKAFGLQQSQWSEEDWMSSLRSDCQKKSTGLCKNGAPNSDTRWKEILDSLNLFLRGNNFFQHYSFSPIGYIQERLISTGFSWLCCDAGLLLDEIIDKHTFDSGIAQQTQDYVQGWCLAMWSDLKMNAEYGCGLFDHREIILKKSHLYEPLAFRIHTTLIKFLCDMNLSFSRNALGCYAHDLKAQRNAFFRFSRSMEDTLESSRQEAAVDQLNQAFSAMGI